MSIINDKKMHKNIKKFMQLPESDCKATKLWYNVSEERFENRKTKAGIAMYVALALFAGVISAFVDNAATVLMIAPVALEIYRKLNTNPVPACSLRCPLLLTSPPLSTALSAVRFRTKTFCVKALDFLILIWYNFLGKTRRNISPFGEDTRQGEYAKHKFQKIRRLIEVVTTRRSWKFVGQAEDKTLKPLENTDYFATAKIAKTRTSNAISNN